MIVSLKAKRKKLDKYNSFLSDKTGISDISKLTEKSIVIDGVDGWQFIFKVPSKKLQIMNAVFIKNGQLHTITLAISEMKYLSVWNSIISSFKSKQGFE